MKGMTDAEEKQKALVEALRGRNQQELGEFTGMLTGKPAITLPEGEQGPVRAAQAPDIAGAYKYAAGAQNPALQQFGVQGALTQAQQQAQLMQQEQLRQKYGKFLSQPGVTAQQALAAGIPEAYVKAHFEAPLLGKEDIGNAGGALYGKKTGTIVANVPNPNRPFNADGTPNPAFQEWELKKAAAGRPTTSVNVNTATKPFLNELGKGAGEAVLAAQAGAKSAQQTLANVQQMRQGLEKAFVGPLAGQRMTLAQLGEVMGVGGKDNAERLQNTRMVMQGLARQELSAAASMKGQGQITESERAIMRKAESGQINEMTKPEIETLLGALTKTSNYRIQQHERNMGKLRQDPNASGIIQYLDAGSQQAPSMPSPAGGGVKFMGFE
jgi:hypothetical protein